MPLPKSLTFRLAAAFLGFVVVGSVCLVTWLQLEERRESHSAFVATARANAQFVRSQRLPTTERTAQALGEVLGMKVYFHRLGHDPVPDFRPRFETAEGKALAEAISRNEGEVRARGGGEAVRVAIDDQASLLLFRNAPVSSGFWTSRTLVVLSAFWTLSLALAWVLARSIVRPLRSLAQRLPRIADEDAGPPPEAARPDEIGQLARAYIDTRAALTDERRARMQAERLATLGRMATGLAHEINNPVAAIRLHAQLLEMGTTSVHPDAGDEGTTDSLAIILAENAKIEALVNQWMFLARPQPPQTSPCDPAELIAAALRTHAPAAAHARVKLVNETQPGNLMQADARRLGQAIGNVIVNAIQAMAAEGGVLKITAGVGPDDERRMTNVEWRKSLPRAENPGFRHSSFVICFADTGPGFSAAALARHAELFYSEKEGGMGIGLSVTAEILRAHGGGLRVENSAQGAVVTFILPLITEPQSEIRNRNS